ncbi:consortin [Melanotaenia boesemani]|uniref:consortin n=1 Tax=Melanotaenia boesemani TaxID=1250792 RepID=UPI001C04E7E1|nr:consortin [Melanotaenia boesemani]
MDHDGQIESEGRGMSHTHVDEADNLSNSEALSAQNQNLNETNSLTEQKTLPLLQNEERGLFQKTSLNNNENVEEGVEKGKERCKDEDEEEDFDEVMKEEEEESEGSNCLIRCQSPDTPMTDSSYSETGSLLETPYPLSPGTSPEPTSPVIPEVTPETKHLISSLELSQCDSEGNSHILNTGSGVSTTRSVTCTPGSPFTTGPVDFTTQTLTSGAWPSNPTGSTEASDRIAKNSSAEPLTSSSEPIIKCGAIFTSSCASSGPNLSDAETFVLTALTRLNTSTASTPANATTEPLSFTTRPNATSTELTSTTSPVSLNQRQITSTPVTTCFSGSTCSTELISTPALLESLEQLIERGDDTHLPQYLHQIAEAFVLCKDYQRALWFVQLERLYHQRVLDNLNALQEHWESQCGGTSSGLATPHLDTLKHICLTHTRPSTRDAECASLDLLIPKFEEGGSQPSCTSVHEVEGGMEQKAEDSHCPVIPSVNMPEKLNSPGIFQMNMENPNKVLEGRDIFYGSQLTDKQDDGIEGGEAEGGAGCTISAIGKGLHPSTAEGMDQSKPAEQQRQDLGPAPEKEAKGEEVSDVGETTEPLEMEDEEAEDEGEEKQKEGEFCFGQNAVLVETLVSGVEVEVQQIHQDALAHEKLHDETQHHQNTQESSKTCLHEEAHPPQETHMKQHEQYTEEKEEEWDYEVDQADIIREASSLDDMAKLITVQEISPASGLVSILKKRSVYVDSYVSARSEPRPKKATATRRVRFKVPDDNYEHEIGGGDSCLLLFLLCLVTVVISVGGTALYCAFGDTQSSVCQDFSRNADFYIGQIHRGILQIQHWFTSGS